MDESVIEGNGDPTTGRVSFSLVLFEAQEFVGIVNVRVAQIFDIAETHTCIETEDEGIADVLFLELVVSIHEFLNLLLWGRGFLESLLLTTQTTPLQGSFAMMLWFKTALVTLFGKRGMGLVFGWLWVMGC